VEHTDCRNSHLIRSIHASRVKQCLKSSTENGVGNWTVHSAYIVSGHHKVQSSDISEYTSSDWLKEPQQKEAQPRTSVNSEIQHTVCEEHRQTRIQRICLFSPRTDATATSELILTAEYSQYAKLSLALQA